MMKGERNSSDFFHDVSYSEYHEIVQIYATIIVSMWDNFHDYTLRLNHLVDRQIIAPGQRNKLLREAFRKIRDYLSNLLIEQFYNTGDENLFDTSLMLNEKVNLEEYSTIDLDSLNEEETGESFMLFYEGIFITIDGTRNSNHHHLKIIVRNEKEVKKINKKLNRSRQILEVDEVTLGKKYYEGLCQRSHFIM